MENLFREADKPDVMDFVDDALTYDIVQGVALDYDPYWLNHFLIREFGSMGPGFRDFPFEAPLPNYPLVVPSYIPFHRKDEGFFENRPPMWERYNQERGRPRSAGPIILKVILRPRYSDDVDYSVPKFTHPRLPVVTEARPESMLYKNPKVEYRPVEGGISIGVGSESCSLGGIIEDSSTGYKFGITCSHIFTNSMGSVPIEQPAQGDGGRGNSSVIGMLIKATSLAGSTPKSPAKLDLAYFRIDDGIQVKGTILNLPNKVSGYEKRTNITPGQTVYLAGKESAKLRQRVVGPLILAHRLGTGNFQVWYKHLFEIRKHTLGGLLISSPAAPGDSGAWIVTDAANSACNWAGSLVGGDSVAGYANFAESAYKWLKSEVSGIVF